MQYQDYIGFPKQDSCHYVYLLRGFSDFLRLSNYEPIYQIIIYLLIIPIYCLSANLYYLPNIKLLIYDLQSTYILVYYAYQLSICYISTYLLPVIYFVIIYKFTFVCLCYIACIDHLFIQLYLSFIYLLTCYLPNGLSKYKFINYHIRTYLLLLHLYLQ